MTSSPLSLGSERIAALETAFAILREAREGFDTARPGQPPPEQAARTPARAGQKLAAPERPALPASCRKPRWRPASMAMARAAGRRQTAKRRLAAERPKTAKSLRVPGRPGPRKALRNKPWRAPRTRRPPLARRFEMAIPLSGDPTDGSNVPARKAGSRGSRHRA